MAVFTVFGVIFGLSGVFGVNQKSPKISFNTYRMILILRQFNSMGETLYLGYEFGAWPTLENSPLIQIFSFPILEIGGKYKNLLRVRSVIYLRGFSVQLVGRNKSIDEKKDNGETEVQDDSRVHPMSDK